MYSLILGCTEQNILPEIHICDGDINFLKHDQETSIYLINLIMKLRKYIVICSVVSVNVVLYSLYFLIYKQIPGGLQKCHSFITSSFLTGSGLGNVMFQYASMYGISQKLGLVPALTEDLPILDNFRLSAITLKNISVTGWSPALEAKSNAYDKYLVNHLNPCFNLTLVGFFQSWRYFEESQHAIREQFGFPSALLNEVQKDLHEFLINVKGNNEHTTSNNFSPEKASFVGVHIRRGDFLEFDKVTFGYTVAGINYTRKAMQYMENNITKSENIIYVVATDDPDWTRSHLRALQKRIFYSNYGDPFKDLALMSQCNHSIISTGTYSWWSGWLAGGQVIYYKDFPRVGSKLERGFSLDKMDYFPPHWIGL